MANDRDLLRLAARSGMKGAFIGVETLNAESLKSVGKGINRVEEYTEKLDAFKKVGVSVSANMIFGFEEDTRRTFKEAYEFISKHSIYANPYILTPYPGTKLFKDFERGGKLLHKDWRKYTAYQQVVKHERLGKEEIEDLFWETYLKFYSFWQNFKRIFRRPFRSLFSFIDWYLHLRIYFYNAMFISRPFIKRRLPPYF
jgi:radical SAM superfamily enzyme YgiQ (UPF0313 family)